MTILWQDLPMFTGIIEAMSQVLTNEHNRLTIERPQSFNALAIGSSIAIAGVCLTIVGLDDTSMSFDTIPETLNRTTLGKKKKGDRVNLERTLKADGRFEGHVVQGHVEGRGRVSRCTPACPAGRLHDKEVMLTVEVPKNFLPFIVEKGSIALDGVSLTVASLKGKECIIALIPHTLRVTTLGLLKEGDVVNIETDILGRYIRQC